MAKKKSESANIAEAEEKVVEKVNLEEKSEETEKPVKKARKKKEPVVEVNDAPVAKEEAVKEKAAEKPRKKRAKKVITEEDEKTRDCRALLKGAHHNYTILSGMLERIETTDNISSLDGKIFGIVHYGNFKIVIPASQMGLSVPTGIPETEKFGIYKKYMNSMLGATIDYVVTKVSESGTVAAGNRAIAMAIKRKRFFQGNYRNSGKSYMEYAKDKSLPVTGNVVAVSGSVVRLDLCGAETTIKAKDASWRFVPNLSDVFAPGDEVKVIVKDILYNGETQDYKVEASIRESIANPQIENVSDYREGCTCIGTVTGVDSKGYHISIGDSDSGIESFCTIVHGTVAPQIGDTVSCQIIKIDYENGFTLCKITRIIRKAIRA